MIRRVQGSQVRDTGIFRAHAARYEAEFLEDMTKLGEAPRRQRVDVADVWRAGCLMPDVLTRVSEFIQPIIVYIQRIIARGLAYESNGSVCAPSSAFFPALFLMFHMLKTYTFAAISAQKTSAKRIATRSARRPPSATR